MMSTIKRCGGILALVTVSLCAGSVALAGPIDESKARAHLDAVAAGDLDALMRDYSDDAYMDWVGGPLDGRYHGKAEIRKVWEKFIAVNAGKPRPAEFGKLVQYANPKGTSVEAKASYGGALPLKVLHLLTYRDGELNTEIWQIAPAVQIDK
jgi:hypothetical protein